MPEPQSQRTGCSFDAAWQQGNATETRIDYRLADDVRAASLEVVNGSTFTLQPAHGTWSIGLSSPIPVGTTVILHATNTADEAAQTQPFGYLVTMRPITSCEAPVVAPRACGDTLDPTWSQGAAANNWWVDYAIEGASAPIVAASLEVMGVEVVDLSQRDGRWAGLPKAVIASGAPAILHAQDAEGHRAQTDPFGYLTVDAPRTQPCS